MTTQTSGCIVVLAHDRLHTRRLEIGIADGIVTWTVATTAGHERHIASPDPAVVAHVAAVLAAITDVTDLETSG